MEALQYHTKVGLALTKLIQLYHQVLSKEPENELMGFKKIKIYGYVRHSSSEKLSEEIVDERLATFNEQMIIIKVYMLCYGNDKEMSEEDKEVFKTTDIMDGLVTYYALEYIEAMVKWLEECLIK